MASVLGVRRILREDCGAVNELVAIVDCWKDRDETRAKSDLGMLSLQCMKAVSSAFQLCNKLLCLANHVSFSGPIRIIFVLDHSHDLASALH